MIQNEAFRCKGITEKLLDFSRMGDVAAEHRSARVGPGRDRHGRPPGQVPGQTDRTVPGDRCRAGQSAGNQAGRAEPDHQRADSLDPAEVRIEVATKRGEAELMITDNGCGMTPEVLEHLFEPFFTRRRDGQGTGLGLSIAYRIVADHDGYIEVHSDGPGQGSQFRVRLPLVEAQGGEHHRLPSRITA